jgi:DNA-binding FadR family transcriptional regulator
MGPRDDRLEQHRGILTAIGAGAPESARERMAELLNASFDDMRKFRESLRHTAPAASRRKL